MIVFFLTETWLDTNGSATLIEATPANYNFSQSIRAERKGGGTASIINEALKCRSISFGNFISFEYHAVILKCVPPVLVVTVYRPPHRGPYTFLDDFSEILSMIHTNHDQIIITGDFNLHVDVDDDSKARDFTNLLNSMDFSQHVSGPTHSHGHTLDLLITKGLTTTVCSITDLNISDHFCIFFKVSLPKPEIKTQHLIKKRCLNPAATVNFKTIINNETAPVRGTSHVNELVTAFNNKISTALDAVAPEKTKVVTPKQNAPWRNEEIKELKRICRRSERKWRKNKLQVDRDIFKEHLFAFNKAIRNARRDHFSKLISKHQNNSRILFSTIDYLLNSTPCTPLDTPSTSMCEEFALHFTDKINQIRQNISKHRPIISTDDPPSLHSTLMCSFKPVDMVTLCRVVSNLKSSTCSLDPIPTKFFKAIFDSVSEDVLEIVNLSLSTGIFPSDLKTALLKPTLKKSNLDPHVLSNYRPISSLPFLKILEKIVFNQLNEFLSANGVLDCFQSGFRKNHSTETALVKVLNDLWINSDLKMLSILVLLDLSAAFDTVDHDILIKRLENLVGLSGPVLEWFRTYLIGREFYVSIGDHRSKTSIMTCGVPQGSVLGPLLFSLYMLPLHPIIKRNHISYHSYADDTQLYISMTPPDFTPVDQLTECISEINSWMSNNFLQLNPDKTEIIIIGNKDKREALSIYLKSLSLNINSQARNLGVLFDTDLSFEAHVKSVVKTCFYHLRNITKVMPFLSCSDAERLVHAFITSKLDYCNALLAGLPKKLINQLQLVQNSAARVLKKTKRWERITPVLQSLHWLPVSSRIEFKVLLLVYKSLHNLGPKYLSDLLVRFTPGRVLRSEGTERLVVPHSRAPTIGGKAFSRYAPALWNNLPVNLRLSPSVDIFKRALKTYLFNLEFPTS